MAKSTVKGFVTSDKMQQTITVRIDRLVKHPVYEKVIKRSTKVHANDPQSLAKIGDFVELKETRPLSKTKNWELVQVLSVSG